MSRFSGVQRFDPSPLSGPSSRSVPNSSAPVASRATHLGIGLGGKGLGKTGLRRHQKIQRDTIRGVTNGDIRRLARRGGVKRISKIVYDDIRHELKSYLQRLLKDVVAMVEHGGRKTVSVQDVVFCLNRIGRTIYL
ncbi:histone-fold-containing protein [Aaosphaeria arxii CBS 175.79]|uniref:Histone H4 n=1 Tax=Aaosphaeria arxii CBS 175.79 TaxID=1450172 RepID=A0A6A5Y399_9PLEO|nr:histone-fold-containing protein [Aaosphaeria arxii CBS 175.79]KAF2019928.1 histone-fold-containing protein [Aaosphaeria arxii CBS 175.79]